MAEGYPGSGTEFSSLAEYSKSSPEKKGDDDDDEDIEPVKKKSTYEFGQKSPNKLKDDKNTKKGNLEKEVPLESLAGDEKLLVVDKHRKEANKDLTNALPNSVEENKALGVATFYEVLKEIAGDGEDVEEQLDTSLETALDIMGVEPGPNEGQPTEPEIAMPETTTEDDPTDDEDDATATNPLPSSPPPPPTPPTPPPDGGAGGNTPPGQGGANGPTGPGGPPFDPAGPNGPGGPNVAPNTNFNLQVNVVNERRRVGGPLLLGGLIGYMIGRRGGRIRTENKLLPIQHKLEKEVTGLQKQLYSREEKIRSIVENQISQKPEIQEKIVNRIQVLQEIKQSKLSEAAKNKESAPKIMPIRPEKLGMFAMGAERPLLERIKTVESFKGVEQMTRQELLEIANKIPVEQSTLKKLYEVGRLDDRGLQRIIKAYLRGEHLERVIRDNLRPLERQDLREVLQDNISSAPAAFTTPKPNPAVVATNSFDQSNGSTSARPEVQNRPPNTDANHSPANHDKRKSQTGLAIAAVLVAVVIVAFIIIR